MRLSSAPQHFDLRAWKNKKRRMSCWISRWGTSDFHLYPAPWLTSDHDSCTDRGRPKLQSHRLSLLADPEASNSLSWLLNFTTLFLFLSYWIIFRHPNGDFKPSEASMLVSGLFQFSKVVPLRAKISQVQDKLRAIEKELATLKTGKDPSTNV